MATVIEICNSALITLGASPIQSFNDGSTNASMCDIKYPIARQSCLRIHPWNFATKRSEALSADVTKPRFRYDFAYTLPSDCLRVLRVYGVDDYKVEGRKILTNDKNIQLKYIYDNTDSQAWDALFTDMIIAKIALELSYAIPGARTMIDAMNQLYQERLIWAKAANAQEDFEDEFGQSDHSLTQVRY
jgi:hypothetical protein